IPSPGGVTKLRYSFPEAVDQGLVPWAAEYLNERLTGVRLGSRAARIAFDEPALGARERAFLLVLRGAFAHTPDDERRLFVGGAASLLDEMRTGEIGA